jgi:hypothetical protein
LPIGHYIIVIEAENTKTFGCKKCIAARITLHMLCFEMLATIEFYDQVCGMADKVRDVRPDRSLSAKTCICQTVSA